MKPFTLLLVLAWFAGGADASATTHEYVVTVDDDLRRMHIAASFGETVDNVAARARDAGDYLTSVRDCTTAD